MENQRKPFTFKARIMSFKFAFKGIAEFFQTEHNAMIHLIISLAVIGMGMWLSISKLEWIIIICLIGIVFMAELFNTAIERLGGCLKRSFFSKC
jgi:diacylglycerol kinase (ATP)